MPSSSSLKLLTCCIRPRIFGLVVGLCSWICLESPAPSFEPTFAGQTVCLLQLPNFFASIFQAFVFLALLGFVFSVPRSYLSSDREELGSY